MTMSDRLQWLFLGFAIGFVAGYTVSALRVLYSNMKKGHEDHVRKKRNEDGFMRYPIVQDVAIISALLLTLFAAFSAARTNAQLKQVVECNKTYLGKNLAADTARSEYLRHRLKANANLQQDQAAFLNGLLHPELAKQDSTQLTQDYLQSLHHFLLLSKVGNRLSAYPTVEELNQCLDK